MSDKHYEDPHEGIFRGYNKQRVIAHYAYATNEFTSKGNRKLFQSPKRFEMISDDKLNSLKDNAYDRIVSLRHEA